MFDARARACEREGASERVEVIDEFEGGARAQCARCSRRAPRHDDADTPLMTLPRDKITLFIERWRATISPSLKMLRVTLRCDIVHCRVKMVQERYNGASERRERLSELRCHIMPRSELF